MYLYDWQTGAVYFDVTAQMPVFYIPTVAYQPSVSPLEAYLPVQEPGRQSVQEPSQPSPASIAPARKGVTRKRNWRSQSITGGSGRSHHRKNIRNIIPNLARKILGFICSEDSRTILRLCFPDLSQSEVSEYYRSVQHRKSSLSFYIGNRDLARIWYDPKGQPQFLKIARVLSKWFLENECAASIVLSRRMKTSLKIEHLRYRHKILAILQNGAATLRPKDQ